MENSSFGRVIGVLLSPTKTFQALAAKPTWVVALAVLLLTATVATYLAVDRVDFEEAIRDQLAAQNRPVPDDAALEQIAGVQKTVSGLVAPIVFGAAFYFLAALVFMVALKLAGSEIGYMPTLSTLLHGYMPGVVKALLTIPVVLGRGEISLQELQSGAILKSNLAMFAPEEAGAVVLALLSSVDLFSIWCIVLMTIGFSIVGNISRKSAAVAVVLVWLVGIAVKAGFSALGAAFGG